MDTTPFLNSQPDVRRTNTDPTNRPPQSSFISHIRRRSSLRPVDLTSPNVSLSEERDGFCSTSKLTLIPDEVPTPKFIPLVLRRYFLLSLILAFACLAGALGGIYDYSKKHQGLTTTSRNLIYISRYGPTAILTVIAALWSKIEYRTKQLAPWKEMSKGFARADKTLLLDYVSPINFIAGVSALKAHHFAVALSVLGSLIIRILIIISTGLLVLQNQIIQHNSQPLKVSDKFDASSFNASSVDTRSYLNVYGVAHLNQSFPRGTTHQYAFQSFNTSNSFVTYNSTLSAKVDVFEADLECEIANKSSVDFIPHSSGGFVSATTSSCSINMRAEQLTWGGWVGYMKQASCTNQTGEDARRFLICTAHISESPPTQTAQGSFQWRQYVTDNTTCLMCIPTYRITTGKIDITGDLDAPPTIELDNNSTNRKTESLSDWEFGSAAFNSMSNTSAVLGSSDAYTDNTGFFQLMNYTSPLFDRPWELLNSTYLLTGSRTAFALLGAQLAKTNLLVPDNSTIPGSYQTWESRLMVQKLAFGGMEALLILLVIMTIGLLILHHKSVTPRDIGSMAGLSTILAGSSDIMKLVNGTGHLTTKELEDRISNNMYQTSTFYEGDTPEFRIVTSVAPEMNEIQPNPDIPSETTDNWWRPFGLSVTGRCLIFIAPVWLIILLQSMLYLSQTGGISVVPSDQYLHYFWTFLPAIVLQLIAILFDVFHSGIRVLQPYFTLRSGGMPASGSMFDDSNSKLSVQVLWSSAWRKHVSLFSATIAVLCAPFLSIVVSGLYQTNNVDQIFPAHAQMNGWFNSSLEVVTYGDSSQKKSSVNVNLVPSLLMYGNATCPRWTDPQFAFGQFGIANFTTSEAYKTMNESDLPPLISASVPAVRGVLNCTTHNFQLTKWNNSMQQSLNISGEFSNNCFFSDGKTTSNQVNLTRTFTKGVSAKWITFPAGSKECPTSMAVFGDVDDNPTTLVCKPYMERLLVNATFILPTFELYPHVEPKPQTQTAQVFSNESAWTMTEWITSGQIWGDVFQYALIPVSIQDTDDRIGELDTFFQALLLSNYMTKTEKANTTELINRYLGPSKTDDLITGMESLYSLVMAQQFHSRKRFPLAATNSLGLSASTLPANITTFIQQRLYQDPTSTYILLWLLSTMFICGAIAILTMNTKPVLPKNPCSIGAVAGLLSDADFLTLIPPGSEWCNDRELALRAPFDSYIFSLGWWSRPGCGRRRFGIDVGKAEKSG